MTRLIALILWTLLVTYGQGQVTRVMYIGEIPVLVAGLPAATPAAPTPTIPEDTTPTPETVQDENVTEIKNDADEGTNLTYTTPTVSFFPGSYYDIT